MSNQSDQNSVTAKQWAPDELCERYGIKKAAYYKRLEFLGMKAEKDSDGKAYLNEEEIGLLDQLDAHIKATGKMNGFMSSSEESEENIEEKGELAIADEPSTLAFDSAAKTEEPTLTFEIPIPADYDSDSNEADDLFRQAAELKAESLAMPHLIKLHLANQIQFKDLPPDLQEKVRSVQVAASPKQNPAQLAQQLLEKRRSNQGGVGNQQVIAP